MKVIREHSNFRIGWDLLILILILISCGVIPFQIAFQRAAYRFSTQIIYFIDLFFLIDILLNFFTSYRHHGVEVTEKHLTVRRYLKTLFVVDLVAGEIDVGQTIVVEVANGNTATVVQVIPGVKVDFV